MSKKSMNFEHFTVTEQNGVVRPMTSHELQTYVVELRGELHQAQLFLLRSILVDVVAGVLFLVSVAVAGFWVSSL